MSPIVSAATAPDGAWTSSVKDPDEITRALATELTRQVDYLRVEIDGAERAARKIAELLEASGQTPAKARPAGWTSATFVRARLERKTRVNARDVETVRLVRDEHGWLRLAS